MVTSPLQRCLETADLMLAGHDPVERHVDDRLGEVRYGDWTGGELKKLAKDPLWKVVQSHPSAMTFPGEGGESMRDMQARAVDAVREWNTTARRRRRLRRRARTATSSRRCWPTRSGMHLDQFQRLVVDPCVGQRRHATPRCGRSSSAVNDLGGDLGFLVPRKERPGRERRRQACRRSRRRRRRLAWRRRRDRIGSARMARIVFEYDPPERFVAGTVGEPGQRTFFLQARGGGRTTSVALEKQQVSVLAERVDELLDEVVRRSAGEADVPAVTPAEAADTAPLDAPIEEEFRVGTMALAWDADDERRRDRGPGADRGDDDATRTTRR